MDEHRNIDFDSSRFDARALELLEGMRGGKLEKRLRKRKLWGHFKSCLTLLRERKELRSRQSHDWRSETLARFQEWLRVIPAAESAGPPTEGASDGDLGGGTPDLLSFYSELCALRRDVEAQAKSNIKANRKVEELLEGAAADIARRSPPAESAADENESKARLAAARRDGAAAAVKEFLDVADCARDVLAALAETDNGVAAAKTAMIADKLDDSLRRLRVTPIARLGGGFNATEMRAVAVLGDGRGESQPLVHSIIRQGYRMEGEMLRLAEVEVVKGGAPAVSVTAADQPSPVDTSKSADSAAKHLKEVAPAVPAAKFEDSEKTGLLAIIKNWLGK